jgi:hypothetical protein
MNTFRRPIMSHLLVSAVLIAGFATLSATPASAASVQVSGVQTPVSSGPCFDPGVASFTMQGSLIGCWYFDTFNAKGQPSGTFQATGTEHFVGCLDLDGDQACTGGDRQGTLYFSFQFTGKLDPPVTGAEIRGRCQHPIIAGTGDFAGASGVITFKDDVTNGTSLYRGPVKA